VIEHFLATPQQAAPVPTQEATTQEATTQEATTQAATPPATGAAPGSQASAVPAEPARPPQKQAVEEDAYLAGLDKKQVELRIKRTELLLRYTKQHPDVVQIDRQLEQLRIERADTCGNARKTRKTRPATSWSRVRLSPTPCGC